MPQVSQCQACLTAPVECEVVSDVRDRPFRVCGACAHRLENLALRPLEWYRLAALHGPPSFLLHDDFYDEDGKADQNRIPVEHSKLFRAPTLQTVSGKLEALLDFAITRWWLREEVVAALSAYPQSLLLSAVSDLARDRPIDWVQRRCYEIAARVLGPAARQWIDENWDRGSSVATIFAFLEAAASCLPRDEAVPRAIEAVEGTGTRDLSVLAMGLAYFQSPRVLDWIESQVRPPVSDRWGWLAARSCFTWHTAARWLDSGRPMSLVALDALASALCPPPVGRLPTIIGEVRDAPAVSDMIEHMRDYARRDPVPRVTGIVEHIARAIGGFS
jgi:hypothetical protein